MTSKLTRERIELIANFHRAMTLPPSHDEIEELARMALAAMDSEPVYQIEHDDGTWSDVDEEEMIRCRSIGEGTRTLYTAPPSTVVDGEPVAWTDEEELNFVNDMACMWTKGMGINEVPLYRHAQQPVVPEEKPMPNTLSMYAVDAVAAIAEVKGWNACRAAMLNHPSSIQPNTDAAPGTEIKHPSSNSPVIPDGYVMVPKEPTESMVIDGFESEPDETFSEPEVWEAFQKMSGCEQAAFRARLCWAAMLAAAPQEEK